MVPALYKWSFVLISFFCFAAMPAHPIFVSVTEIEHNQKDQSLEISCKVFTDDFEKILRQHTTGKVDLVNPPDKKQANLQVKNYITRHLQLDVDGKRVSLEYLGYEIEDEGVISFWEVKGLKSPGKLNIQNTLLYEASPQQMGIMHVTVNGKRQSARLDNPTAQVSFSF